jgi:protein-S-isoprenylcysteine O-methyltransferase Ste14
VRHPSYAGVIVAFTGVAIAQANVVSVAAALVCVLVAYVPRIRVEEREMEGAMGTRYLAYEQGRARLIPGIW